MDRASNVQSFLNHWKPDIALRVESEIWPETLQALARRQIPRAIVQARLSASSARLWRNFPKFFSSLLQGFNPIIAQSSEDLQRLHEFDVPNLQGPLNLKADGDRPDKPLAREKLQQDIGDRPLWLASSTHPGEEKIILEAHRRVQKLHPRLLTIILPRHPHRGVEIENLTRDQKFRSCRRSQSPLPGDVDVYIADTLGETGLFYRLAPVVFVGGSLVPIGGHNLLEPAQLECAVLHGPHIFSQFDIAQVLLKGQASLAVTDGKSLGEEVSRLLSEPPLALQMSKRGKKHRPQS